MKFYPCLIVTKNELYDVGCPNISFTNGRLTDISIMPIIEDYCRMPIVSIRESTRDENEIFVFVADGYLQKNPMNDKRTVVLMGNFDTLKVVLSDIFAEHPEKDPYEVFHDYSYQTDINIQLDLQAWVRDEYQR